MKWHRIIFWSSFIIFSAMTIAGEAGHVEKESIIKFLLFVLCTAAGIFTIDFLVKRWFAEKRYDLFIPAAFLTVAFAVMIEMGSEFLLLGAYPLGWKEKLLENIAFIAPWIIVALAIFIAEDFGRQKMAKTAAELLYLKHQVNPHFLLNTHNNINFLIQQDPVLASAMLLKLSGIMQYMLYECSADTVPLEKELKNLSNYIELEKIRKNDNLKIIYEFKTLDRSYSISPLLLITFVENAFKHMSNLKDRENFVRITAVLEDNVFHFDVINSKANRHQEKKSGIGLKNVNQRLKLLYPGKHQLVIDDRQEKYSVHLTIDLY
jgi:two-component system, LytTR family, sensor kinase